MSAPRSKTPARRRRAGTPPSNGAGPGAASADASRMAAMVLEVLGGLRSVTDAAKALGVSMPRYYAVERRALEGLVKACEPGRRRRGPRKDLVAERDREIVRLETENRRLMALVRAARRSVGLKAPPARKTASSSGTSGAAKKRRKRRPAVRALKLARNLREATEAGPKEESKAREA